MIEKKKSNSFFLNLIFSVKLIIINQLFQNLHSVIDSNHYKFIEPN